MKIKSLVKIILVIIIFALSFVVGIKVREYEVEVPTLVSGEYIVLEGYKSSDDKVYFLKYYYTEDSIINESKKYRLDEKNVENVKRNIKTAINKFQESDNVSIEFNYDDIKQGDLYILITDDKYSVNFQYFCKKEHVLYVVLFEK